MKPHALTSPLARFRSDLPQLTATEAHPLANIIYQARCEIVSNDICSPTHLSISSGYSCVAVLTAGGYKNRVSALTYFLPTDGVDKDFEEYDVNVGLAGLAYHGFVSEERRLIFAADTDRIKSYAWASGDSAAYEKALPTHTLDSNLWHGPLTILPDGRLLRAGTGSAAFWDLDTVGTHGPKGRNRIGKRIDVEDTWRDDPEEIETSHGSAPTGRIEFHDSAMAVGAWHPHPSSSGVMLCAPKDTYACVTLDLVHGGKTGARYIGHGGNVEDFSTSGMDVNVFATAGSDGCARLYDVRHPLPVLTFDAGRVSEACSSVILTHPDGIPSAFSSFTLMLTASLTILGEQRCLPVVNEASRSKCGTYARGVRCTSWRRGTTPCTG
jgi:WD40 repeat protein